MRSLRILATLALPFCLAGAPARAADEIVYRPLVSNGSEYRRVSYPQQAGPVLVLADTPFLLEAVRAPVSFWPITREYLPDLVRASPPLAGTIEVDGAPAETALYVVWYPKGVGGGAAELVSGEAASGLYDDYLREARAAAKRLSDYQSLMARHEALLQEWLKLAGERRGSHLPPPPPEFKANPPEPYPGFATKPERGALLSLPAGRHTLRLRDGEGNVVAGSERTLESIAPDDDGFGYIIRPANRWNQPSVSLDPGDIIYTTGETDLFLEPVPVARVPSDLFARLFSPQSMTAHNAPGTTWMRRELPPADHGMTFVLRSAATQAEARALAGGYRVAQTPGTSLGYTIEAFVPQADASLEPDFTGARVANDVDRVSLEARSGGAEVRNSARELRVIKPPSGLLVFMPALLPLAFALAVRALRRRRRRPA